MSTVWVVFTCALAIAVMLALGWASRRLGETTDDVIQDTRAMAIGDEITAALLALHRTAYRVAGDRPPGGRAQLARLEERVRRLLERERHLVRSDRERALVVRAEQGFEAYVAALTPDGSTELRAPEAIRDSSPALDATLATLAELRGENERDVVAIQASVESLDATVTSLSYVLILVQAIAALLFVLGIRRLVLAPLRRLLHAIARFRSGERNVRVPRRGSAEVAEIGAALGEMIGAIERQRTDQLTFIASVAHDLRSPLAAMKLGIGVLARDPTLAPASPSARSITILERQAERLTSMVGDLLDATRIESGHLELRAERFDLGALLESAIAAIGTCAPHTIDLRLPAEPVVVDADPHRIEQVVANLVANAIKYSPEGGPIEVRLTASATSATLEVVDHGIGIPRDAQQRIFTPFHRHDAARAIAPGVGLGLSVARRIAEAHGGALGVHSEPGRGSTFSMQIPLPRARAPAQLELPGEGLEPSRSSRSTGF